MSGQLFIDYCRVNGLYCVSQERIAWGGDVITDAFSLFTTEGSADARPVEILENSRFMEEAETLRARAHLYDRQSFRG
jgi:hypothetical protein